MNLFFKAFVVLLLLFPAQLLFTQEPIKADKSQSPFYKRFMIVRTAPKFTLQLNFTYNQSVLELAGTYNDDFRSDDFISGQTFGTDKGFGANITTKLALNSKGSLRLINSVSYNRIMTYMFGKSGLSDIGETKFNVYSAGIGLENNFTPNYNFKLYAGGEILASLINGEAVLWVPNQPNTPYTYKLKIKNSFRLGFDIYGGTEYLLTNELGVNLGFKFTLANLFLRKSEIISDSTEIILEDGKPDVPGKYLGSKNFGFFSLHFGICIYWGIIEKKYELFN
jgi:membrane associated rhomboid family serine protease